MSNHNATQLQDSFPTNPPTNHAHAIRRIFIGPMPERIITHTEQQANSKRKVTFSVLSPRYGEEERDMDAKMQNIFKEHAYRFFLKQGGQPQDWGEEEEQSTVRDMLERWRESEWGKMLTHRHHRKDAYQPGNWVGGTFEVGRIFGVNVAEGDHNIYADSGPPMKDAIAPSASHTSRRPIPPSTTTGGETFVTAPSEPATPFTYSNGQVNRNLDERASVTTSSTPATSSTALLSPRHSSGPAEISRIPGTTLKPSIKPILMIPNSDAKGKGRAILDTLHDDVISEVEEAAPLDPSQVLDRTPGSNLARNTSAAAEHAISPVVSSVLEWGDVMLRDRMLVRVIYTRSEALSPIFDDAMNRTTRDLHFESWGECLVAWRKDNIEIYEDHSIPGKEWITGQKRLAYVVPLKSSRTRLSLYSWADLTFCITCPPTTRRLNQTKSRWIFSRAKEGTNIFVFKLKSRSRAYDWTWQLWRHMGGHIPESLDIQNPTLSSKVKIDIPDPNLTDTKRAFSQQGILDICMSSLRQVPGWRSLVEREILSGRPLQLCWRVGANLDWIWLDEDVNGNHRPWAVLCGMAFKQSAKPPTLEVRLADHCPSHIYLKNGCRVEQPPAIEGYVDRIRPNTKTKQSMYLVTHDGNLFTLHPSDANPPSPPSLVLKIGEFDEYMQSLKSTERKRGSMQIMSAIGVCDLRSIAAVRRAFQQTTPNTHDYREVSSDDEAAWFGIWSAEEERTAADNEDKGGEAGLNAVEDRAHLKMRRSFELLLTTGHLIRFEAHSCCEAIEWIQRLRALSLYWKMRHRIDATEEVELAHAVRPRLTPKVRVCQDENETAPLPPPDLSTPSPALNNMFNWCAIDGCKSITKVGKLYVRNGLHGPYKLVQMFLVNGHLTRFHIKPKSSLHTAHRKKISLVDAYVSSGYFAAITLPKGQYSPNAPPPARRYQDGLETDDRDEDMLFVIWYRPHSAIFDKSEKVTSPSTPAPPKSIPTLSTKFKLLICRARSKLERDSWCWALNCEIERIVRKQKGWEQKLRETGNLQALS